MIRVLIVDDSSAGRGWLSTLLAAEPGIAVVGAIAATADMIGAIAALKPDLMLMNADLQAMGGLLATRTIMRDCPLPIVLLSEAPIPSALEAEVRQAGALAVVERPGTTLTPADAAKARHLVAAVRTMAGVTVIHHWHKPETPKRAPGRGTLMPLAIGLAASTGGPAAFRQLLSALPLGLPCPVLLVQHMHSGRIDRFAGWLASVSALPIRIAQEGARLAPGEIHIAPEAAHLGLRRDLTAELCDGPPIDGFRPSASYLFSRLADACGARAVGVILTGMGRDGVDGLAAIKAQGGTVIAQDEQSCAVFGMPKAAIDAGLADRVLPLDDIAAALINMCGIEVRDTQCVS